MAKYDDIIEVVGYTVSMIQGYETADYDADTLASCRRLYDSAVKAEVTRRVDAGLKEFERGLAKEGKRLTDRAGYRKLCIEDMAKSWKSFDEWRAGF